MAVTLTLVSPDPGAPGLRSRISDTRAFLRARGLIPSPTGPYLLAEDGALPVLDGNTLHLEMSWLGEGARGVYATVWDAQPGPHLAELVFDLADVARLLLTPSPAPPHIIACGEHFPDAEVVDESVPPWLEVAVRARTPPELEEILAGGWPAYRITYADRYWT
ncbi:hypothetical protein [Corynebacterium guangdongense]|uniref:Uncharacterized protein n=1 Tax=Corynebacterium guangdongense TaxID=1783348 RepID=A0ABU1ZY14_9CORY|nr:hypothetical protein [Corynebacterium guangdongense]MDR7329801.1 hypothetical protein [Corynebacterium guangdongense]WJZ18364.1 hypothetical protein CGUA_09015 [Corynebacterium guangdongense]